MTFNFRTIAQCAGLVATAACATVVIGQQQAQAAQLGTGWMYSYDAVGDGSGGSGYDIKGIAMSVQDEKLIVALTGGMPITGNSYSGAADGNVGWGDMFFNFTGKNFNDAQGQLFGIHFSATNDSPVATGVYTNVKTTSVTGDNSGYSSLNQYYSASSGSFDKQNTQGSAIATSADAKNYYGASGPIQTSIASGNKVGEIAQLFNASQLATAGLNFGGAAGDQTFGFSINRNLLPTGSFLANLFLECGNDGVAISGSNAAAAPEPTTMAGMALAGSGLAFLKRRQKKQAANA